MIERSSLDELYIAAISQVLNNGLPVVARGLSFKECTFQHLVLSNPRSRIVYNPIRCLSKRFLIAEFIWMMSGQCNLEMISHYNKRMAEFSDDGVGLNGAYGPRLRHWSLQHGDVDQLENCLKRLKSDIYTRQAAIVILNPAIDFVEYTKDVPCNNYLQFLCRDNKLHLLCYVRSNDLYLGLPYDVFHWTMLQEMYATMLGVDLGEYHHFVGSLHIYDQDMSSMSNIVTAKIDDIVEPNMPLLDLTIINKLSDIEKKYRLTGCLDMLSIDEYWHKYLKWLIK